MASGGRPGKNIIVNIKDNISSLQLSVASLESKPIYWNRLYGGSGSSKPNGKICSNKRKAAFFIFDYKSYVFYNEVNHKENCLPSLIV